MYMFFPYNQMLGLIPHSGGKELSTQPNILKGYEA